MVAASVVHAGSAQVGMAGCLACCAWSEAGLRAAGCGGTFFLSRCYICTVAESSLCDDPLPAQPHNKQLQA